MKTLLLSLLTIFLLAGIPEAFAGEAAAALPPAEGKVALIGVSKSERKMYLLDGNDNIIRAYRIALGFNPVGHKEFEGDGRTPEGVYEIDARNINSEYYKSLRISYPRQTDRARARQRGLDPGGDIFIHGEPNGRSWMFWKYNTKRDWTQGCIAVTNRDIDEIWQLVEDGTPIVIRP